MSPALRQYALITGNYWAFTLTDGALRMLVVLYFHQLGYAPLQVALLFIFYEVFGVLTNLLGGWLGARIGLDRTMNIGLALQVIALGMLAFPPAWLTLAWVMAAQALSGIAKDLNKMSAKSSIKLLVPADRQGTLFRWVAALTGSKNALKGVGFFLGGALLATIGFRASVTVMAGTLLAVLLLSLALLARNLGKSSSKPKFRELLSKSRAINALSAARLFLFAARDVWFVIALPVFLAQSLGWSFTAVGSFMAAWIIGYGVVQAAAPWLTRSNALTGRRQLFRCAALLACVPATMVVAMRHGVSAQAVVVTGLAVFGVLFAVSSSIHSYLIIRHASADGVSLDVGFYYTANAFGRLLGTVLSGWAFQVMGFSACLWISSGFAAAASLLSLLLPGGSKRR